MADLHKEEYQYYSLNACRSAIGSMHTPIDRVFIGQDPLVSRLLKGASQSQSPLPRYTGTWDVNIVLTYINKHQRNQSITLKKLSLWTVMLLALTHPSHPAALARMNLIGYRNTPEVAVLLPTALAKQSRPGRDITDFFFPKFTEIEELCPVHSLSLYMERTKELRGDNKCLFISFIKPHNRVKSSTIATL